MSDTAGVANPMGLRERKKARTRAVIRQEAMRLFRERGYSATTVEQIAAAADVSPATFFRYYPTKEDVVIQDDLDVLLPEAVEAQPPGLNPIAAVRAAIKETMDQLGPAELERLQETIKLTNSVPELRARSVDEFIRTIDLMAGPLARRAGRSPGDDEVRNMAGAMIGVLLTVTLGPENAEADPAGLLTRIDAALAHLEAGLPL